MKINTEKSILAILLVALAVATLMLATPTSDNYVHYNIARQLLRDPALLYNPNLSGMSKLVSMWGTSFTYPPMLHLAYAFMIILSLPFKLIDILSFAMVLSFTFLMDKVAPVFMGLSFMFLHVSAFGGIDIFMLAIAMASIFLIDRKPLVSGALAGLTALIKGTGFIYLVAYALAIVAFRRDKKHVMALVVALLVLSPWYVRNFIINQGDFIGTIYGVSSKYFTQQSGYIATTSANPEMGLVDTTGYYPLPIDLLLYIGLAFTIWNIYKLRRLSIEHVFIMSFAAAFFGVHLAGFTLLYAWRYYLPIFPLLAIQIAQALPQKALKFAYVGCFAVFLFFMLSLPKYSFNDMDARMPAICGEIAKVVNSSPTFVQAFHSWYVAWKCDINSVPQDEAKWVLDFDNGKIYEVKT